MDDVLPKPFTRKSLLEMLEKHLFHLKKISSMEAPPSATAPSMHQSSATHSVKDDSSPGQSPAGSIGNWQSPSQYSGMSSLQTNMPSQYLPVQNAGYQMEHNSMQYSSPTTPLSAGRPPHRRHVSEMAGGPGDMNDYKRQRMYQQPSQGSMPSGMISPMSGRPR